MDDYHRHQELCYLFQTVGDEAGQSTLKSWGLDTLDGVKKNIMDISIHKNGGIYERPVKITSSSGAVLVVVFTEFVLKIFSNNEVLDKVVKIIQTGKDCPFLINLYDVFRENNYHAIITNVLDPLTSWTDVGPVINYNLEDENILITLLLQIGAALERIHSSNYTHGDSTLDNIGVYRNKFMLFDLNCGSLTSGNTKEDINLLFKSIGNRKTLTNHSKLLNYLKNKNIKTGQELIDFTIEYYKTKNPNLEQNSNAELWDKLSNLIPTKK
jgi:tRNA A-37 threonylcarbamoyl transferase component Bud32